MTIETDFVALLIGDAGVSALVDDRVAQDEVPDESPYPLVIFSTNHNRTHNVDGSLATDQCGISAECWAETAAEASSLADAVIAAIATAPAIHGANVLSRSTTSDPALGLSGVLLSVEWWELAS